ncbi:putative zinc finger (C2H2 type) protein [Neospora caninum Liverpool]|uniref:Putative zinc finger (C2H2 type) protein n=1 Tax=Neospora caninum (strain Liverpool) TaxID=572307 RepID=F0VK60_NEOCL|nr:putative zinc finger (C2H2 type) protein [Neospora caninum Liverpool]CBZ54461.1 putative zinc finger (C2H2 type) protein [Neospora caninum Liverpool]CEL69173.1 TPA: zinc finger (C2H2 type) protein, putative [Neospora caninum Liverpool]|eukprot:XP_003884491.1 putative zinc finger (C2H2 type) protein [Neospora caninum Liverpool]
MPLPFAPPPPPFPNPHASHTHAGSPPAGASAAASFRSFPTFSSSPPPPPPPSPRAPTGFCRAPFSSPNPPALTPQPQAPAFRTPSLPSSPPSGASQPSARPSSSLPPPPAPFASSPSARPPPPPSACSSLPGSVASSRPPPSPPPASPSPRPCASFASAPPASPGLASCCYAPFRQRQSMHAGAESASAASPERRGSCAWSVPASGPCACASSFAAAGGNPECSGSGRALAASETPRSAHPTCAFGTSSGPSAPAQCRTQVSCSVSGCSPQRTAVAGCPRCSACCASAVAGSSAASPCHAASCGAFCGASAFPAAVPPPPPPPAAPHSSSAGFAAADATDGAPARNGSRAGCQPSSVPPPGGLGGDGRRVSSSFQSSACGWRSGENASSAVSGPAAPGNEGSAVPALPAGSPGSAVRPPPAPPVGPDKQMSFCGGVPPPPPLTEENAQAAHSASKRRAQPGGEGGADASGPDGFGKKRKREEEFVCLLCDKAFRSAKKQQLHEEEEHLPCDYPGCTYAGPVHVMIMHKLKHLKNEKGESLLDSEAEVAAWRAARKENFPSSRRAVKPKAPGSRPLPRPKSVLERILRETMESAYGRRLIHPAFFSSAFCPELPKMLPHPPLIYSLKREFRFAQLPRSPYTHPSGLCPSAFLVPPGGKGPTRDGRLWAGGKAGGPEVPLRPPLLYQLLAPEIRVYEEKLLAAIRFIVQSNFFLNEPRAEPEEQRLIEVIEEAAAPSNGAPPSPKNASDGTEEGHADSKGQTANALLECISVD